MFDDPIMAQGRPFYLVLAREACFAKFTDVLEEESPEARKALPDNGANLDLD